jgi:AcrR family transcriptional regulator
MATKAKRPYHHGDLRVALIRAALTLIAEHGIQGLALSDAARLAGVSVAAPYRHFKDREALLAEIAAEGFVIFRDALARASERTRTDKARRLVEMGVAYVEFALQHPAHFKVMWESGLCKADYPEVHQTAYQAYQLLEAAAMDLLPAPHAGRALVNAAWSLVHGYATLTLDGELDTKLLRRTLHLLVDQFAAS